MSMDSVVSGAILLTAHKSPAVGVREFVERERLLRRKEAKIIEVVKAAKKPKGPSHQIAKRLMKYLVIGGNGNEHIAEKEAPFSDALSIASEDTKSVASHSPRQQISRGVVRGQYPAYVRAERTLLLSRSSPEGRTIRRRNKSPDKRPRPKTREGVLSVLRGRQSRGEADAFAKPSNLGYNVPLTWIPEPYSVPASLPECKTSLLSASPRKRRHVKNYTPLQFPDVSAPKMTRNLRPATCPPRARYFADRKEKPLLSNPLEQSLQKMSNDFSKAVSEEMGMRESIKRDIALHKEQLPILYRWEKHIDVHLCREYARAHLERMFDSVSRAVPRLALRKWCHIARVERRLEYVNAQQLVKWRKPLRE